MRSSASEDTGQDVVSETVVEVVLATYNGATYLKQQLASIEAQEGVAWRLIAADDGSTDRTRVILEEFRAQHADRVRVLPPLGRRLGPAQSFGRLLSATSAPYVSFSDQDDVWLPRKLATAVTALRNLEQAVGGAPSLVHGDLVVVDGHLQVINPSLDRYQNLGARHRTALRHLLIQNSVTGCTVCVNRSLIDVALPLPPGVVMHDWWLALVAAAFGRVAFLPEPFVLYRQHANNVRGARRYGLPRLGTSAGDLRTSLDRTYTQAEALLGHFGQQLPADAHRTVAAYVEIPHLGPIARRVHVLRHRFLKNGAMKAFGALVAM